jgi:hypothetical protein
MPGEPTYDGVRPQPDGALAPAERNVSGSGTQVMLPFRPDGARQAFL